MEIYYKKTNKLVAWQMMFILASLYGLVSVADGILKKTWNKLPPWGFEPRSQPATWIHSFVLEIWAIYQSYQPIKPNF